jgi:hypothetical protein
LPIASPTKGIAEDVDRVRGHVRSALGVVRAQRNADGDRGPGGIDELLQSLEVIRGDGGFFVVRRLLPFRRPERPPVKGIAAEPQRRRPERLQLLVEVGLRRIETGVGQVGGFEGDPDVVCGESSAGPISTNSDGCLLAGNGTIKRLLEFGRGRARFR